MKNTHAVIKADATQTIWPLGDYTIAPLPEHPVLREVGEALEPLRPLLRSLSYDLTGTQPSAVLGLGAEFHLASVRLLDEETLLIDFPVGEVNQTPQNLQRLLSENLRRSWPFRVDGAAQNTLGQVVVVIEQRLALKDVKQLHHRILEGWISKVMDEGLLRFLNGQGEHL